MSKVNDTMFYRKGQPYPVSIATKFYQNIEHNSMIIIVEGISDEDFYGNTNIKVLNKTNALYIWANQNANIRGKQAVIEAYFRIREWSKNTNNNSVVFIVDKDFFGVNWNANAYKKFKEMYKAKSEDIDNFTILNCHSHECYFILQNNLKQIFRLLNIEDKLEDFEGILKDNLDDLSEYFAYRSILEDENPNQPREHQNTACINFNFQFKDGKLVFNKEDMQRSISEMKSKINNSELENQYLEMKRKLKNNPELLRGHNLYELLECYLKQYGKTLKYYKEYNNRIIKNLEIPLNIKVLKLSNGHYKVDENVRNK